MKLGPLAWFKEYSLVKVGLPSGLEFRGLGDEQDPESWDFGLLREGLHVNHSTPETSLLRTWCCKWPGVT